MDESRHTLRCSACSRMSRPTRRNGSLFRRLLLLPLVIQATCLLASGGQQQQVLSAIASDNTTLNGNQTGSADDKATLISSSPGEPLSSTSASPQQLNSSQAEQAGSAPAEQAALPDEPLPPPPPAYYYGSDMGPAGSNYEAKDGTDLSFSVLNPAQERIQAVKSVLSTRSMLPEGLQDPLSEQASSPAGSAVASQCTHKGRQFSNGQTVPIEDQPCLSCTCRRAILQCYLRVCPPVISVEAHKRMQAMATLGSGGVPQKCRTVKEAHQCCPSIKCEPDLAESQASANFSSNLAASSLADASPINALFAGRNTNQLATETTTIALMDDASRVSAGNSLASNRSVDESPAIISTTPPSALDGQQLPKLTVIKGASGQRDSILLITSNPSSVGQQVRNQLAHKLNSSSALDQAEPGSSSHRNNAYYNHLLESLLETVYSSAAQLNGVNLQGSCMINGSLYVEGSAVLPEGNAYCQYCYCIRQKIMCVKPKCHLIISGCTPKYSNEFACCPTSYSCVSSPGELPEAPARPASNPARLSAKLSAAIESISRLSAADRAPSEPTSQPRQVDRSLDSADLSGQALPAAMLALMKSIEAASNETGAPAGQARGLDSTPMSTSTTTPSPSNRAEVRPSSNPKEAEEELGRENDSDELEEDDNDANGRGGSSATDDKKREQLGNSTLNTNTTTEQPSSVSDFLEPMNKLGPLVMSPTSGCTENGRQYAIGEQIPTLERCKHCYCGIDGLKECKVMECSLRIAHNCKPVTPEGHCCPIRYDCPSSSAGQPAARDAASRSRSRSETGTSNDTLEDPSFKDVSQCKSESGLLSDCAPASNGSHRATRGNLDVGAPILETTRIVDSDFNANQFPAAFNAQQPVGNQTSPSDSQRQQILSEELNKFIMQIKNQTAGHNITGYSLPAFNLSQDNPATQEMMINDQHSRMVDYHSVQAPGLQPQAVGIASIEPELANHAHHMLNGAHRMEAPPTTGQIVPADPVTGRLLASWVDYATEARQLNQAGGLRDSRSANSQELAIRQNNRFVLNELLPAQNFTNGLLSPSQPFFNEADQPDVISDDYLFEPDTSSVGNSSNGRQTPKSGPNSLVIGHRNREMPHVRLLRNQHAPGSSLNLTGQLANNSALFNNSQSGFNLTPLVVFDDALGSISNSQPPSRGPQQPDAAEPLQRAPAPTTRNTTLVAASDEPGSSPTPPQPTTGTPIGLDVDRAPETRNWMKQMSGLVKSFGRRLYGQGELESAASAGPAKDRSAEGHLLGASSPTETSGRSRQGGSLLEQLLQSVLGTDPSATPTGVAREEEVSTRPALVMRPLGNEIIKADEQGRTVSSVRPVSPYDPAISTGPSEVEIVTAAVPVDQDLFPSSSNSHPIDSTGKTERHVLSSSSSAFAKRTDLTGDDLIADAAPEQPAAPEQSMSGSNRNSLHRANKQLVADGSSAHGMVAPGATSSGANKLQTRACFDAQTNRTYQANEIIVKDDPCKTCICLLGEERCQTLVCPEKPAENCSEERRSGECCANYLCGGSTGPPPFAGSAQNQLSRTQAGPTLARTGENSRTAQQVMQDNHRPLSGRLLQRAMLSPEIGGGSPAANSIHSASQQFPMNLAPAMNPMHQAQNNNRARNVQQEAADAIRQRHQLPPYPIKVSDLNSILPSHLRFRPNNNGSPNPLLPNQLAQARVIFNSQAANQLRYPTLGQPNQLTGQQGHQFPRNIINNLGAGSAMKWQSRSDHSVGGNGGPSAVRPPVLVHPAQRAPGQQLWSSALPTTFSVNDNQTGRPLVEESSQPMSNMIRANWNWKSASSPEPTRNEGLLPPNVLTPRMSAVQQVPAPAHQQISESQPNSSSWQPTSWLVKTDSVPTSMPSPQPSSAPFLPIHASGLPSKPLADSNHNPFLPATVKLEESSKAASQQTIAPHSLIEGQPMETGNRVVFQSQHAAPDPIQPDDPGFRPIVAPAQRISPPPNQEVSPAPGERTIAEEVLRISSIGKAQSELSQAEASARPEQPVVASSSSDQSEQTRGPAESGSSTSPTFSSSNESSKSDLQPTQPTTMSPASEVRTPVDLVDNQGTTHPQADARAPSAPPSTDRDEQGTNKEAYEQRENPRPDLGDIATTDKQTEPIVEQTDFGSMFRFSECNIYGRIYQVGQEIEEVSSGCSKRCACTPRGVECQNKC